MNNLNPGFKCFTPRTRKTYDTVIKATKYYLIFQTSGMQMCSLDTMWINLNFQQIKTKAGHCF